MREAFLFYIQSRPQNPSGSLDVSEPLLPTALSDYWEQLIGLLISCSTLIQDPTQSWRLGPYFDFRPRKLEQGRSHPIPGKVFIGSPASTIKMPLPSRCTSRRMMHCKSTSPECILPPSYFPAGYYWYGRSCPGSGRPLSELMYSQKLLRNFATILGVATLQHHTLFR